MRIVSLLPSATEIVCALGLSDQLVGVTHECDYPIEVEKLPKVTKTVIPHDSSSAEIDELVRNRLELTTALYSLRTDVLRELKPDLIVTQALCDVCAVAESEVLSVMNLLPNKPDLVNLEPMSIDDVLLTIRMVGEASNNIEDAQALVNALQSRIDLVKSRTQTLLNSEELPRVVFLEWIDPLFNAGHWNPELIQIAGGEDCLGNINQASRTTDWQEVLDIDPDFLFIACCGFDIPRTMQDIEILKSYPHWKELSCVRKDKVYVSDGNAYFSRSGPRLIDSLEIIAHAMHPAIHPLPLCGNKAIQIISAD
jgi:iron complex transport system substrate-binding protein